MNLQTTKVYRLLAESKKRISVFQGGARSGKTFNILVYFVMRLLKEDNKVFSIVRDSLPSIRGSVYRDWMEIMLKLGLYNEHYHNRTEQTYLLGTNVIEFVSADQSHRIRGRKRNYLFINEANELHYDSWMQLVMRTDELIVLDYNPSDEYSWIYEHVLIRNDIDFNITTYLDNPFLAPELVAEIERLQNADEDYWRIFGLGLRGSGRHLVYNHWKLCDELPAEQEYFYGLDFGYNHPSALVRCCIKDDQIFVDELIYQSKLTTADLAKEINGWGIEGHDPIYCDYADPRSIEELGRLGFNALPCEKKDVKESIMKIKSMPLFITRRSCNLIKEIKNYKWRVDKNGILQDEPVKFMDDACDSMRYAVFSYACSPPANWIGF